MTLFKSYAADNDQNSSIYQYREGRTIDAHHGCSELQKAQNIVVKSDVLIIQNNEPENEECLRFYSIPNPADTSRTIQRRELYKGTVKFMHF